MMESRVKTIAGDRFLFSFTKLSSSVVAGYTLIVGSS